MISYAVFSMLGVAAAIYVGYATRSLTASRIKLLPSQRLFLCLSGFVGAVFFAKLPFLILEPESLKHAGPIWASGKTILLGLAGGYLGVELAKKYLNIKTRTGDSFVVSVAVGIGVGRLGCFFSSCCYGTPTELFLGVVFPAADSLPRHPIQIYECCFHLLAAAMAYYCLVHERGVGQLMTLYLLAYFLFRFLTEFIRPEISLWPGLSFYQWAIVFLWPCFFWEWRRTAKHGANPSNR